MEMTVGAAAKYRMFESAKVNVQILPEKRGCPELCRHSRVTGIRLYTPLIAGWAAMVVNRGCEC